MNTEAFNANMNMLNTEQKKAVETLNGPVMVIAGPGTGKTQIIGMRTANIILKAGVDAGNILITTFTEAGVIAIRERLISMIGSDAYKVQVSTIHSFAQDVIKNFPEKFTEEKMNTAIDDAQMLELISEIMSQKVSIHELEYLMSYGDPLFYVREVKNQITKLKGEGVSISHYLDLVKDEEKKSLLWLEEKRNNKRIKKIETYEEKHEKHIGKLKELGNIYGRYNELLREKNLYDFNDMINFVLEKIKIDSEMRSFFAETYQYIMLDEYQDTNNPQNEIINLILSESEEPNIMVVGDDDQSIYRFQGANIENMLDFTTKYPQALLIVLEKNYRSQQMILNTASELIGENSERLIHRIPGLKKDIIAQRGFDEITPTLYEATTQKYEEIYITQNIKKYISQGKKYSDIAIIVRSNSEVSRYSELLSARDMPVYSKFETNILDSAIIGHIFGFLKIIENPFENEGTFLDILRCSFSGVSNIDVLKVSQYLYRENYVRRGNKLKIYDVISSDLKLQELGVEDITSFQELVQKLDSLQQIFSQQNIVFALSQLLSDFHLLENENNGIDFNELQDISTLFAIVKNWQKYNQNLDIGSLLEKVELYKKYNLRIERIIYNSESKGVQIVTAHSSKGLEYDHVFIPGLYTGNWDNKVNRKLISLPEGLAGEGLQFAELDGLTDAEKKKYDEDKQMQEDRRLFFVALTRAKYNLHMSYPQSIDGKIKIISPFISEISTIEKIDFSIKEELLQEKLVTDIINESRFIEYSQSELDYISGFFDTYKLSASDLNTFLVNPRDFLYRTLLRYPFEENENSIFGTMYHRTLELFYKQIQETGKIPDFGYVKFVFERQLEKEFLSDEQRVRLRKRGLEGLEGYLGQYDGTFKAPLKTEYRFSRRNIFFEGIPLTGIIDKIELLDETYSENISGGSLFSQTIKITDYKTGSSKYLGDIKGQDRNGISDENYERGRYGRQLMFYKLLFENDAELSSAYSLGALELDFCEGKNGKYKRQEVEFSDEEYSSFKNLVIDTYKQMTSVEFWKEYLKK